MLELPPGRSSVHRGGPDRRGASPYSIFRCVIVRNRVRRRRFGPTAGPGYGEDELARTGAFRVDRDTSEYRESPDELGLLS
jgi:hypothetical protein